MVFAAPATFTIAVNSPIRAASANTFRLRSKAIMPLSPDVTLGLMRVAIVHYWLVGMRGAEHVIESFLRLLPQADIFTLFYEPDRVSPAIRARTVHTSF